MHWLWIALLLLPLARCQTSPPNAYWSDHGGVTDSCPYICNAGFVRVGAACVSTAFPSTTIAAATPAPAIPASAIPASTTISTLPVGVTLPVTTQATQAAQATQATQAAQASQAATSSAYQITSATSLAATAIPATSTVSVSTQTTAVAPGVYLSFQMRVDTATPLDNAQILAYRQSIASLLSISLYRVSMLVRLASRRLLAAGYVITVTIVLDTEALATELKSQVELSSFQAGLSATSSVPTTVVQGSAAFQVVTQSAAQAAATTLQAAQPPPTAAPAGPPDTAAGPAATNAGNAAVADTSSSSPTSSTTAIAVAIPVAVVAMVATGVTIYWTRTARPPTVKPPTAVQPSNKPVIPVKIDHPAPSAFAFNP